MSQEMAACGTQTAQQLEGSTTAKPCLHCCAVVAPVHGRTPATNRIWPSHATWAGTRAFSLLSSSLLDTVRARDPASG